MIVRWVTDFLFGTEAWLIFMGCGTKLLAGNLIGHGHHHSHTAMLHLPAIVHNPHNNFINRLSRCDR